MTDTTDGVRSGTEDTVRHKGAAGAGGMGGGGEGALGCRRAFRGGRRLMVGPGSQETQTLPYGSAADFTLHSFTLGKKGGHNWLVSRFL